MPLDADDLRKIHELVDRYIPRVEYDNRHIDMVQRVTKLEDGVQELSRYVISELEKARVDREATFHKSMDAIEVVRQSLDDLKDKLAESRSVTLRYVISVIVSFLLGSGIIGTIEFFRSLHP